MIRLDNSSKYKSLLDQNLFFGTRLIFHHSKCDKFWKIATRVKFLSPGLIYVHFIKIHDYV